MFVIRSSNSPTSITIRRRTIVASAPAAWATATAASSITVTRRHREAAGPSA